MILKFGHLFPRHLIYIYTYTRIYTWITSVHIHIRFLSSFITSPTSIHRVRRRLQYLDNPLSFSSLPPSLPANQRLHYFSSPLNDFTFATTSTSNAPCPLIIVCAARIEGNINGRSWWTTFRETLIAMFFITCIQWCQFNGISVRIASRLS